MKNTKYKYEIVGCDHRYVPEDPYRKCADCDLKPTDLKCVDDIACGERYYVSKKTRVK